jgi:hypothetical protein
VTDADDSVPVGGAIVRTGSRVRIAPNARADAMDMFLAGKTARVTGVFRDFDDRVHVAVVLDDDPGADLRLAAGRFLYIAAHQHEPHHTPE